MEKKGVGGQVRAREDQKILQKYQNGAFLLNDDLLCPSSKRSELDVGSRRARPMVLKLRV